MEHVGIVVDDLEAAAAFFVELGLEPQGEGPAAPRPSAITSGQAGSLTRPGTHAALSGGGSPTSASTAERESRYPILSFGLSAERIALKVRVPRLASRSNE